VWDTVDAVGMPFAIADTVNSLIYQFKFKARSLSDKVKRRLDAAMLEKLREQAEKDGEAPRNVKLPPWVNHDLRRTLRSRLSELRIDSDVAEAILAHAKPGIRGVYDRYEFLDEKRHALELWATQLRSFVESQLSNVVSVRAVPAEKGGTEGPRAGFAERIQRSRRGEK